MRKLLVAAIVAVAGLLPTPVGAAPGDPVAGFGTAGVVTGGLLDAFGPVTVDAEGRIVVLGVHSDAIAIARYLGDGQPDVSFSGDGRADLAIPVATFALVDVRVLDDGAIVAIGRRTSVVGNPFTNGLWAAKVTSGGAAFPGYGSTGVSIEEQGFTAFAERGSIASDGSAVMTQRGVGGGWANTISATGVFDTTTDLADAPPMGCTPSMLPSSPAGAMALSATEFVWVQDAVYECGGFRDAVALTRASIPSGAATWTSHVDPPEKADPDQDGQNGVALAEVGADVLVATSDGTNQWVRRYSGAGQPVTGWGSNGRAPLAAGFGTIGGLAALTGGRVAVVNGARFTDSPSTLRVDVLLPDGTADPTFPRVSVPVGGAMTSTSIATAPNGDILVTTQRAGQGTLRRFAGSPPPMDPPISGGGPVAPGASVCFTVAGSPGDVALVNLTPVLAGDFGNGQLISSDVTAPDASNVNFGPGTVDPNVAAAPIGSDGKVCYVNSNHSTVQIIADHLGSISRSAITLATPTGAPARKVDTRRGLGGGLIAPGDSLCFSVAGSPGDVALVNLTPILASDFGNGQLISSGLTPPDASNVNFGPGTVDPNVAAAPIGADGKVCFANSNHANVHLVADHLGTISEAKITLATPTGAPARKVDTRRGLGGGLIAPGDSLCFAVAGSPGDVALVNLTPVLASGFGNGQLISSGLTPPDASNVNFGPGTVDPNVAAAPIGADGEVCFANSNHSSVHLVADHLGTIDSDAFTLASATGAPARRVDTR